MEGVREAGAAHRMYLVDGVTLVRIVAAVAIAGVLGTRARAEAPRARATARLTISVRVIRSAVVTARAVALIADQAARAPDGAVFDAAGNPLPVVIRFDGGREAPAGGARYVYVLVDGAAEDR